MNILTNTKKISWTRKNGLVGTVDASDLELPVGVFPSEISVQGKALVTFKLVRPNYNHTTKEITCYTYEANHRGEVIGLNVWNS